MNGEPARAEGLALVTALASLLFGGIILGVGLRDGAIAFWGFGAACLLQVAPALSLRQRIRDGLGNRGLDRERLTLRIVSHLLRLLAFGMALTAMAAIMGERAPQADVWIPGLALLALGGQASLWFAKRSLAGMHPSLELDASRTRTLLEGAALLLLGSLVGQWFPWADAATGLALALRFFLEGRTLAKGTTVAVACGGCGTGCH